MSITAATLVTRIGVQGADSAKREVQSFGDSLGNMARSAGATGAMLSMGVTAPLVAMAAAALTSAAGFEQSMNVLQQVTGASEGTMASLSDEALRLGAVTSFSAGEAADAMLELGKAGMSTDEIMASIGGVMSLAAAGGIELAQAAGITAAALNAFGLEASEANRVADLLAATANASAADISDLAQGFQQAGFAFAAAGQPIDDLAASLAILTNVGLTGSDAGTALKNALMQIMAPTVKAKDAMAALGISFFDAQGDMLSMAGIIDVLNSATATMTQEERNATLATIFLSDGMKAMIPLLNEGSAGFNEMKTAVNEQGAASDVAGARMKGLAGAVEYFKGSVDSFLIGTAVPYLDWLGQVVTQGADLLTAFGELPAPVMAASLAFAGVLAAAGPLLLAISGIALAIGFLITPIGLVTVTLAAMAAAWASDFGGMQSKVAEVVAGIQPHLTNLKTWMMGISGLWANLSLMMPSIQGQTLSLSSVTAAAVAGLQSLLTAVLGFASALVTGIDANAIATAATGLVQGLSSAIVAAIDTEKLGELGTAAGTLVRSIVTKFGEVLGAPSFGTDIGVAVGKAAGAMALGAAALVTGIVNQIAVTDWTKFVDSLAGFSQSFIAGVASGLASADYGPIAAGLAAGIGAALAALIKANPLSFFNMGGQKETKQFTESGPTWAEVGTTISTSFKAGMASFTWPELTIPAWLTTWQWPSQPEWLTNWKWPEWTMPPWLGTLLAFFGGATGAGGAGLSPMAGFAPSPVAAPLAPGSREPQVWADPLVPGMAGATGAMPMLVWADYVEPLVWLDYVTAIVWEDIIPSFKWLNYVYVLNWANYVTDLSWGEFIRDMKWSSYVSDLSWGQFVPTLNWGAFIPSMAAGGGGGSSGAGAAPGSGAPGDPLLATPPAPSPWDVYTPTATAAGVTVQITGPVSINNMGDIESVADQIISAMRRRM